MHFNAGRCHHHPGFCEVIETFRKCKVLEANGVPHATNNRRRWRCQARTTGEQSGIVILQRIRQGNRFNGVDYTNRRKRPVDDLPGGGHGVARSEGIEPSKIERIHVEGLCKAVHLHLRSEACLDRAESSHRATRRVVRPCDRRFDEHVVTAVRANSEERSVGKDRPTGVGVPATIQYEARGDLDEVPFFVSFVAVPHARWVALHMTDERLGAVVHHLDGTARGERQHGDMDVYRDVLTRSERATDPCRMAADLIWFHGEARNDLAVVDMDPLAGDVEIKAALTVRYRQAGLRPERRLVLHGRLVESLDNNGPNGLLVTTANFHLPEEETILGSCHWIDHRCERFPLDDDRGRCQARCLLVLGCYDGDRLAPVLGDVVTEHRLVLFLLPEAWLANHIILCEHRADTRHGQCRGDVEFDESGMGVGASQRRAPQHVVSSQI